MRLNKKGIMQAITDTGTAIIVIIVAVLLITFLVKQKEKTNDSKSEAVINNALLDNNLGLYLKERVIIEGNEYSVSDLIVLVAESRGTVYMDEWKEITSEFFRKTNHDIEIHIYVNPDDEADNPISQEVYSDSPKYALPEPVIIYLPSAEKAIKIKFSAPSGSGGLQGAG